MRSYKEDCIFIQPQSRPAVWNHKKEMWRFLQNCMYTCRSMAYVCNHASYSSGFSFAGIAMHIFVGWRLGQKSSNIQWWSPRFLLPLLVSGLNENNLFIAATCRLRQSFADRAKTSSQDANQFLARDKCQGTRDLWETEKKQIAQTVEVKEEILKITHLWLFSVCRVPGEPDSSILSHVNWYCGKGIHYRNSGEAGWKILRRNTLLKKVKLLDIQNASLQDIPAHWCDQATDSGRIYMRLCSNWKMPCSSASQHGQHQYTTAQYY